MKIWSGWRGYGLVIVVLYTIISICESIRSKVITKIIIVPSTPRGEEEPKSDGQLHFLAIGDSLTAGFHDHGRQFHPFTIKLRELFHQENMSISIANHGISGEVTKRMIPLLQDLLLMKRFNYVSILGGTNDLANAAITPEKIFANLLEMYQLVLRTSHTKLIVITIPPTAFDRSNTPYLERKVKINEMILRFYEEHRESSRVLLIDLYRATPYYNEKEEQSELWDDHLHFNPKGYDYFGELVFQAIQSTNS